MAVVSENRVGQGLGCISVGRVLTYHEGSSGSRPKTAWKASLVMQACELSTWRGEAGQSGILEVILGQTASSGQPGLCEAVKTETERGEGVQPQASSLVAFYLMF